MANADGGIAWRAVAVCRGRAITRQRHSVHDFDGSGTAWMRIPPEFPAMRHCRRLSGAKKALSSRIVLQHCCKFARVCPIRLMSRPGSEEARTAPAAMKKEPRQRKPRGGIKKMFRAICWCIGLGVICFALTVQAEDFAAVRRSAEQGDAYAQYILGLMYENGRDVAKNEAEAAQWFRKSADQGYANGQYKLGWVYLTGRVVARDEDEAARWFRKAAEQGDKAAQAVLRAMNK